MTPLLSQLVAWLCLAARAAGRSEVATGFSLVDEDGRDVLSEAAAHDALDEGYRPSGSVLVLAFQSHNRAFKYKLYRQATSSSGGKVVVHGEGGQKTERALGRPVIFRSPGRDAVLTAVGQSFTGTIFVGPTIFDIRHQHSSAALEVTRFDPDEAKPSVGSGVGSLRPNGSLEQADVDRRLSILNPDAIDQWTNCYPGEETMRTFKFGAVITSNVWRDENFQTDQEAEDWVHAMVANANMAYEPQLNIHLQMGSLVIQQTHDGAPSWDQGSTCPKSINDQLWALVAWESSAANPDSTMGVWHLFDNCYQNSGFIGLAWIGVLCYDWGYNTGVTWLSRGNYAYPTWHIMAHELGHNFGAQHSFEQGQGKTGGIMDYGDGSLNGVYRFNDLRKSEICGQLTAQVNSCSGFSVFEAECGNRITEPGETCECSDGSQACSGCCGCQVQLEVGALATPMECSYGALGHGGCCSPAGMFQPVGFACTLADADGYCNEGVCVTQHVCQDNSFFDSYCGLEANGCKIKCTQAGDGTCLSLSSWEVNGHPINNVPDGTPCQGTGFEGTCSAGECKHPEAVTIAVPVTTGAPAEPNPHSTETEYSGCVGFANRGFLGHADVAVFLQGVSLIQCNMQCANDWQCDSFIHRADVGFCELWSNKNLVEDLAVVPGYDTYICDAYAAGFDFLDAEYYQDADVGFHGLNVPARERSGDSGFTRSTCYKTCKTDPGCHTFVFVERTGSCQLYSSEISGTDVVYKDPSDGYSTYTLPCHGRGKNCPCRDDPDGTWKIRVPCQCDATANPFENECGINKYCYDGTCADSPKRRLSTECASTPSPPAAATASPTSAPTAVPTKTPTAAPTAAPTSAPTALPTSSPTRAPTSSPTSTPTAAPTAAPTSAPTAAPTAAPTSAPTALPTSSPTPAPPSATPAPPTDAPTALPTSSPTRAPTSSPTSTPTAAPTAAPTSPPTAAPTAAPTSAPTALPTSSPTPAPPGATPAPPTDAPTATPTAAPTAAPTPSPTRLWTTLTATTTTVKYLVRVDMSFSSTGTSDDVESSVTSFVTSKHGVAPDSVTATASASRRNAAASTQWHVDYDLLLESESDASAHLGIAQQLSANVEGTRADLAQTFAESGLTMDAAVFTVTAPEEVQVYRSCYNTDVGLKDPFEDGCDTYHRNPEFCGIYDDADFSSDNLCCVCGGGSDTEPDWTPATEEPILPPEPGCVDTDAAQRDSTGDACSVYAMDPAHFCGAFDDDDFSSLAMCCACRPYAPPTPATAPAAPTPVPPPPLVPTPAPGDGVLDGATPHGLSAACALLAGAACALSGLAQGL
ncbi:unnamed protein product [Prorocentrum cordatum]|uniref:Peptidase M12B domain-containing protein n=1 Tax=Prorocentrum cordatum TaxID=2364126 RepID=A0ABN9T340_9DINO|nr:unnamed protein product [Polarella glacialis]